MGPEAVKVCLGLVIVGPRAPKVYLGLVTLDSVQ